ncbi:MAG TPA: glycoside hydrolase family 3 N-terminal domain-containing protein [Solirubrobacteraceae bacterium]|jgi:beta-N-acetylhexosaminidase|nr:glycoside hydrolase family 3 N-terminal domain-containing protein [Solirubrobacteraceae bacterium]
MSLSALIGQTIVSRFYGTQPSRDLLARIEAGEIGGVILYGENTADGLDAVRALDRRLQNAAARSGRPPLLIMTDQEGGTVKRLAGPPTLAAAAMSSIAIAQQQGVETGRLLRSVGINVDLAPVVDVEEDGRSSFLGTRSFGSNVGLVAAHACAFADGLASQGVAYTLKHFPGLGLAETSTDVAPVSVNAPVGVLRADYLPYLECSSSQLALVMVDSASYPMLSGSLPAVISPEIYQRELHIAVQGDPPLTISDNLEAPALASIPASSLRAIDAGLDLALYASTERGSATAYRQLLADARVDKLNPIRIRAAVARIEQLKRILR